MSTIQLFGILRIVGTSVLSPERTFPHLTVRKSIALVVLCALFQSAAGFFAVASKPTYIVAPLTKILTPRLQDQSHVTSEIEEIVKIRAKRTAVANVITTLVSAAVLTFFWFGVGWLLRSSKNGIQAVFNAIAMAGVVSALGYVMRQAIGWYLDIEPPGFTLGGLVSPNSRAAPYLSQLDILRLWWASIAAIGLAQAWGRPIFYVLPITVAFTMLIQLLSGPSH